MSRAELRRQLKADSKLVERGLDFARRDGAQVVALMRVLYDYVRQSVNGKSIDPLMGFVYSNLSQSSRPFSDAPIACHKGCSHCCHAFVAATVPEVLHVVKSIGKNRMPVVRQSVSESFAQTNGKASGERLAMPVPCPMLTDHVCSVYNSRPIVCRTGVSGDAKICERSFLHAGSENIPTPFVFMAMRTDYTVALAGALRHANLGYHAYEYNSALKLVLDSPGCEADWLSGTNIFADLLRDPIGDQFQIRQNQELYEAAFA